MQYKPQVTGPQLKQPTFKWSAKKSTELKNFEMVIRNIIMSESFDIAGAEEVPIKKISRQRLPPFH